MPFENTDRVISLLKDRGFRLATAESCTAGLLSAALTSVAGASEVFECGVTAYSIRIKHAVLGVSSETLDRFGAVSAETAREMAMGVRRLADADLGVAITGVAGPSPSEGKPVGLVFLALADRRSVWAEELRIEGDRESIRTTAVQTALARVEHTLSTLKTKESD